MDFTELVSLKSKGEARAWEEKRKSQTAAEGASTHPKAGRLVLLQMAQHLRDGHLRISCSKLSEIWSRNSNKRCHRGEGEAAGGGGKAATPRR